MKIVSLLVGIAIVVIVYFAVFHRQYAEYFSCTSQVTPSLTPMQHKVIRCGATEPAFANEYWNNEAPGIYVDRVSGEVLFSSHDKYDAGTGWPSFTKPLEPQNLVEKEDNTLGVTRTEIRSAKGDSHLGHVFNDGPPPTGLRYCMNSAAMRFIPVADLEKEGYGAYKRLFVEYTDSQKKE